MDEAMPSKQERKEDNGSIGRKLDSGHWLDELWLEHSVKSVKTGENQQNFYEPQWTSADKSKVFEIIAKKPGPICARDFEYIEIPNWADEPRVHYQRDSQTNQAVFQESPRSFTVVRSGNEVGRNEEKKSHEIGLIKRAEPTPHCGGEVILKFLCIDPSSTTGVSYHQVVEDHKDGQEDADIVNEA